VDCNPIAEGKSDKSGDSRRHVGGASGAAVKPWKSKVTGVQPLHTMYVGRGLLSLPQTPSSRRESYRTEVLHVFSNLMPDILSGCNPTCLIQIVFCLDGF
jgi:hypothetical protein